MSLQENTTNLRKILNSVKKLPSAGGVELPTLFAPSVFVNSYTSKLTIFDENNGGFASMYDLYANGEFVTTLTSKTAMLADYIEHTEVIEIQVKAKATNFNSSEFSDADDWVKFNEDGTAGLAYTLASNGTYATCIGIGEATETDIEIAVEYNGVPVTVCKSSAFKDNTAITSVLIPDSITTMDSYVFSNCTSLQSVTISKGLEQINGHMFEYTALSSITIPRNIARIEAYAFQECNKLANVIFSGNITYIGSLVFYWCGNLKRVDLSKCNSVPSLAATNAFSYTSNRLQIKVPAILIDQWKAATNWSTYADKIVTEFTNTL